MRSHRFILTSSIPAGLRGASLSKANGERGCVECGGCGCGRARRCGRGLQLVNEARAPVAIADCPLWTPGVIQIKPSGDIEALGDTDQILRIDEPLEVTHGKDGQEALVLLRSGLLLSLPTVTTHH